MTTLAIMKSRISDELARSDLTTQIAYAITDAITAYEDERFFFSESRALTFSTAADQEFYSSTDDADIGKIQKIDYVVVYVGTQAHQLEYERPEDMEIDSTGTDGTGQPWAYTWYGDQIRLYPTPDAVYTVRIGASYKVAAPASDGEASNPWMTHAERLIRSRAKAELALHVLKDIELAQTMTQALEEAYDQLKGRTAMLTQAAKAKVRAMEF